MHYKIVSVLVLHKFIKQTHVIKAIMSIIDYRGVNIHIDSKIILEDVTFTLKSGEFAYIVGTVGSGKSTLLKTIYGEVDIASGSAIVFNEYDLTKINNRRLQELRKKTGIVFQDFQLLGDRNIHDNLDFVLRCTGWKEKQLRENRIREVLELVVINALTNSRAVSNNALLLQEPY